MKTRRGSEVKYSTLADVAQGFRFALRSVQVAYEYNGLYQYL